MLLLAALLMLSVEGKMAVVISCGLLLLLLLQVDPAHGDTPANCTYSDVSGSWTFTLGKSGHTNYDVDCSKTTFREDDIASVLHVMLMFPNVVVDSHGNEGTWTMVYNQGFDVILKGVRYFAFANWKAVSAKKFVSLCHQTRAGWFHDVYTGAFPVKNWGCFKAVKSDLFLEKPISRDESVPHSKLTTMEYIVDKELVDNINLAQLSWRATVYDHYNEMSVGAMRQRRGSFRSRGFPMPRPSPISNETQQMAHALPNEFDWRNVAGGNYVSPVRNQGACGSCYAFASMAMLEARIRIATGNKERPVLSTQNIVSCGNYSQGCEGGYPYLVAGSYSMDFGNIAEHCYPYTGKDSACAPTSAACKRYYVKHYNYVGGFFGGCNEALMRIELVHGGPLAVGIDVLSDFEHYKGGIYHHTGLQSRFDPMEPMNHAVLVVGYGQDATTHEKFWIVKNSWGEDWGESGYFRIRRGTDEIAIESLAFGAVPYSSA